MADDGDGNLPSPPSPSETDGRGSITILGTAHVSQKSVDEVHETVDSEQPDVVAVELDEGRFRQMRGETPDDIEARDLLSGNTIYQFLAYWMLSYVQSQLGERFDVKPGADMEAAIEAAERNGLGVALVDRDIQVTIQRFWSRLSTSEKVKLIGGVVLGISDPRILGITLGAGLGLLFGLVGAGFVAPLLGLEGVLSLGITDPLALQTLGAVGGGLLAGIVIALLIPPLDIARSDSMGDALRLVLGLALGIGSALAIVLTETSLVVVGPASFERLGGIAVRGLVGLLVGTGLGALLGTALGIVVNQLTVDIEEIDEQDIEELTDGDVIAAMLEEFRKFSPEGANALIDERDAYIAHQLIGLAENGYDVLAVVGAGHRAGIERHLEDPSGLPAVDSLTQTASSRRFSIGRAIGYLVMLGFFGFFFLLIMAGVQDIFLLKLFLAWFAFNGVFAFTLARLAGARWTSAGVGGAVAWLTSINPLLAPGWFAGYVELRHRPVNVTDIQTLNDIVGDTERPIGEAISAMFAVPLFRLIMIVALTNVGSMIATFLFPFVVLPWLAGPEFGGVDALMGELLRGAGESLELFRGFLP